PQIAGQDPSVQPIYIEKEQESTDKNQSTNLTLFNTTKLFLTFKTDVFSSLLASQSIYASDNKHSKGVSIQYKFSKKCDLHDLSEPNPVSVCHDTLDEQQLENLDRLNVQSDLVETINYQNTDSKNILEKKINRAYHCSFLFNSYFYIIGGLSYSDKISFVSRLNLKSFEWEHYIDRSSSTVVNRSNRNFFANSSNHEKPKEEIPQNRYSHSCVLEQENKRVFMFGGIIYEKNDQEMIKKQTTSELWIFNLETNKWSMLSGENGSKKDYELPISVSGHSMHLIKR
ncbi:attractin 1, partial [Brachionus plicatilis]